MPGDGRKRAHGPLARGVRTVAAGRQAGKVDKEKHDYRDVSKEERPTMSAVVEELTDKIREHTRVVDGLQ